MKFVNRLKGIGAGIRWIRGDSCVATWDLVYISYV